MVGVCWVLLAALGASLAGSGILLLRDRRHRAAAPMQEAYRLAFEHNPLAIGLRVDGRYFHLNAATMRLMGARDLAEALRTSPLDVSEPVQHGRPATEVLQEVAAQLKAGHIESFREWAFRRLHTGEARQIDMTWLPVRFRGKSATISIMADVTERVQLAAQAKANRDGIAQDFEAQLGGTVQSLAVAAADLRQMAGQLTGAAALSGERAATAVATVAEASAGTRAVAAATGELAASVDRVTERLAASRGIAADALAEAQETGAAVGRLSESIGRINAVVALIADIASQTNLLALNATIEAARAGEAGKGFAVVAGEVKALAAQTARATGDIGRQVADIRALSDGTVTAVARIGRVIAEMADIAVAIAEAVEQQGATARHIARTVNEMAAGTTVVTDSVADVQTAASTTGETAARIETCSVSLAEQAAAFRQHAARFAAAVGA